MDPLRSSQRLGRRRRVLADESRSASPATHRIFRGHDHDGPPSRYTESALQSMHASIADYLPLRQFSLLVWFLAGLIPIAGLAALDGQWSAWAKVFGKDCLHAFDFSAGNSLAAWLSSLVFASAALVMLGIYSVRKHRRDDYRARFTVWRWAIAAAVFLSIDATAQLHLAWQGGCQYLLATPLAGDGSIWWVGAWSLVFGGLWVRLMVEMRGSRSSIAWAGVAGCFYLVSAWVHLDLVTQPAGRLGQTVQTITALLGHHCFLFTLVNYARHVVLEAMGKIDTRDKPKHRTSSQQPDAGRKQPHVPGASPRPVLRTVSAADVDVADDESDGAHQTNESDQPELRKIHPFDPPGETKDEEEGDMRGLSKAERRRLRKEKRKRRAA